MPRGEGRTKRATRRRPENENAPKRFTSKYSARVTFIVLYQTFVRFVLSTFCPFIYFFFFFISFSFTDKPSQAIASWHFLTTRYDVAVVRWFVDHYFYNNVKASAIPNEERKSKDTAMLVVVIVVKHVKILQTPLVLRIVLYACL